MKEKLSVLISEEEIQKRVAEMAKEISEYYRGKKLVVVGILRGAAVFTSDLIRKMDVEGLVLDFMSVSSYGMETVSSGKINIKMDLSENIEGKHVLIVEDVVDTGITLSSLTEMLKKRNPASVKLCAVFDKPARRVTDIAPNWKGFTMPDKFIVGYGLDYAQKYRDLPYIADVSFEEE